MSSHQTFYRKYRSQTFNELIGQDHIKQTLSNAIENNRLSHAYIFSGPRGTGKTSTARILAKSINCRNGASITPCQTCDICKHITSGVSVDVIEIDAASNTGVDHIRDLNDRVNFQPVECKTKLYIIDEVHMLSTGAFNALLKTLEEPPSHTIFILATTEPHKIPATIHSRCQHLYFRNLTIQELVTHLKEIAEKESIIIDEKALYLIARNSGGCMRDAISLLNQAYSFKGSDISEEDLQFILGSSDDEHLFQLLHAWLDKDSTRALTQLQTMFSEGAHASQLLSDILAVLRQALYITLKLNDQRDGDTVRYPQYEALAQKGDLKTFNAALQLFAQTELDLRWFSKPDLLLQIRFLELIEPTVDTQTPTAAPIQKAQAAPPQFSRPAPTIQAPQQKTPIPPVSKPAPPVIKPAIPTPPQPMQAKPVQPATSSAVSQTTEAYKKQWDNIIERIKKQKTALYSILKQSHISDVSGDIVTLKLKQDFKFFRDKLMEDSNKAFIESCIQEQTGHPCKLVLYGATPPKPTFQGAATTSTVPTEPPTPTKEKIESKKLNQIVSMFEGTIL